MTTTTDTPIWEMPKLGMLPSGMSLSRDPDETFGLTILHEDASLGDVLVRTSRPFGRAIREEVYGDRRVRELDRIFDAALGSYAVVPSLRWVTQPRVTSRESVVRRVETLRSELLITADVAAAIAGLGPRRYYELVGGKPFPENRLAEIESRVSIISALAARDSQTMRSLIVGRARDVIDLLDGARFGELSELFRRTHEERTAVLRDGLTVDLADRTALRVGDLTGFLDAPGFDAIAKLIRWIGRNDQLKNRGKAFVQINATFDSLEADGEIGETWDFMYGFDADERQAFRHRAEAFVRGEAFSPERWATFLAQESERAWGAATPVRLEPVEVSISADAEPPLPWQPDLSRLGLDFRLHDRPRR